MILESIRRVKHLVFPFAFLHLLHEYGRTLSYGSFVAFPVTAYFPGLLAGN